MNPDTEKRIEELAKSLRANGLAASDLDANMKAKSILGINDQIREKSNAAEQPPNAPKPSKDGEELISLEEDEPSPVEKPAAVPIKAPPAGSSFVVDEILKQDVPLNDLMEPAVLEEEAPPEDEAQAEVAFPAPVQVRELDEAPKASPSMAEQRSAPPPRPKMAEEDVDITEMFNFGKRGML